MVAGLLYIAGLIAALVTLVMVGIAAPALVQHFTPALDSSGVLGANTDLARALDWAAVPFIGGLVLMGLGRMLLLLGSIDRSLRGNP